MLDFTKRKNMPETTTEKKEDVPELCMISSDFLKGKTFSERHALVKQMVQDYVERTVYLECDRAQASAILMCAVYFCTDFIEVAPWNDSWDLYTVYKLLCMSKAELGDKSELDRLFDKARKNNPKSRCFAYYDAFSISSYDNLMSEIASDLIVNELNFVVKNEILWDKQFIDFEPVIAIPKPVVSKESRSSKGMIINLSEHF